MNDASPPLPGMPPCPCGGVYVRCHGCQAARCYSCDVPGSSAKCDPPEADMIVPNIGDQP